MATFVAPEAPPRAERLPVNVAVILDRSGSMEGERKFDLAREAVEQALYNAHVTRLIERLGPSARVGTVDKFQGQEAPVVIYSMATSRPEDALRGIEFLYSLNRLNVATSRARCAAILVASQRVFEPECRTPRQMKLANALCRFRELATQVTWSPAGRD
jgi:superfamily I DNA and/or RNA helicase